MTLMRYPSNTEWIRHLSRPGLKGNANEDFSPYPGCHEVQSALAEFFRSLEKGRMWWYNILGDNEGSISYLLQLDPITVGYVLLTDNLFALKRVNPELTLTVKRTEWRKFIDYFGRSIEANPSKVGKKNVNFSPYWLYKKHFVWKYPCIKAKSGQTV